MRIKEILDEVKAYHGTDADIQQFRPLTHFGSETAARDRMAYKKINGKIYQVELNINKPAVIKDYPGVHSPTQFAFALKNAGIFTQDEMLSVTMDSDRDDSIKARQLIKLLKSKGYDGIAYKNRYEDKGHISYVILDPSQAKISDTITESTSSPVVYHGNQGGIHRELITPMWWTEDRDTALYYATQSGGDGWIYKATLTCKNPYVVRPTDETNTLVEKYKTLEQQGYDSIYDPRGNDWIPFHAKDINLVDEPEYVDGEQEIAEAFNQPYPLQWERSEYGDVDALAKLADGTNLSIMFNNEGDDEWQVEFYRSNTQELTGEGDAQRIFATVLTAIQQFIQKEHPWRITFSAKQEIEPGQYNPSRSKLYNRLVQRYANALGYDEYAEDHGDQVVYELTRLKQPVNESKTVEYNGLTLRVTKPTSYELKVEALDDWGNNVLGYVEFNIGDSKELDPQDLRVDDRYQGQGIAKTMYDYVKSIGYKIVRSWDQTDAGAGFWDKHRGEDVRVWENFADGKKPGRKGLAKRVGVNCKQPVSKLRSIAAHSSGERQRMAHWCANMKSGKKK